MFWVRLFFCLIPLPPASPFSMRKLSCASIRQRKKTIQQQAPVSPWRSPPPPPKGGTRAIV